MQPPRWLIGALLAAVISVLAYRARALSGSGAVAASGAGLAAMGAGWSWGIILVAYFVTASALSRYRGGEKERRMGGGRVAKHGPRDAVQVLANGGAFVAAALLYWWRPDPLWQVAGIGALAASAADTWATEIGSLAPVAPRSILTMRPVAIGTSGGVTVAGTVAALAGAGFTAAMSLLAAWPPAAATAALVGGMLGCLFDSVLGASAQARYWCASCSASTERRVHHCGRLSTRVGGLRWLGNDGVNAAATLGGAVVGAIVLTLA